MPATISHLKSEFSDLLPVAPGGPLKVSGWHVQGGRDKPIGKIQKMTLRQQFKDYRLPSVQAAE
jgi:hypothetical protein